MKYDKKDPLVWWSGWFMDGTEHHVWRMSLTQMLEAQWDVLVEKAVVAEIEVPEWLPQHGGDFMIVNMPRPGGHGPSDRVSWIGGLN